MIEDEGPAGMTSDNQTFTYYMHDDFSRGERREHIESQGVRLSEEAWEAMGRPFYEVALRCTVTPTGEVIIEEVIA